MKKLYCLFVFKKIVFIFKLKIYCLVNICILLLQYLPSSHTKLRQFANKNIRHKKPFVTTTQYCEIRRRMLCLFWMTVNWRGVVKNGANQQLLCSEAGPTLCVEYEDRLMSKHVGEEATTSNKTAK